MTKVETLAAEVGLHVSTWSPGDGATRYRFYRNPGNSYFGPENGIYTALGRKDALRFLMAWKASRLSVSKGESA